jgi:monoamine oxidase
MNETEIIIIGAGAAGLLCARELANAGRKITILEARERPGGRIYTIGDSNFPLPVELGAEFVHGDLLLTKKLLNEAKLDFYETKGDLWRSEKGAFTEQEDFIENIDEVIKQLKKLPTDIGVADFLDTCFDGEKYVILRKTLKSYVEGYDAADSRLASSFALLQELLGEDDKQYRIKNGYIELIDYLVYQCIASGVIIQYQTAVKQIDWSIGKVKVIDHSGNAFIAAKAVITVPLGVLQGSPGITFSPEINEVRKAINSLGFGSVMKVVLNFDEPVWKAATNTGAVKRSDPGFIFSDAIIPTWWTQIPEKNGMITGWLAGPKAVRLQNEPDDKIFNLALESLAVIFNISRKDLYSKLQGSFVHNWSMDECSKGAYSYETIHSKHAKAIISDPIKNTLYFAGEAYYEGPESGTVEAALVSGETMATKILENIEG